VSFWKRLFGKGCDRGALAPPVGLAQRYLKKYQQFQAILAESEAAGAIMAQLQHRLAKPENLDLPQFQEQCADLLGHMRQALDLLLEFCRQKPDELLAAFAELAARFQEILSLAEASGQDTLELVQDQLRPLLFSRQQAEPSQGSSPLAASASVPDLLAGITEHRLQEMFCLSLRSQVSKKQAVSLVTGRLVPILVIDAGGGLSSTSVTVNLDDVASVPYKAFLDGMLSIPWPKARPLDMKGFISVVGVTSTTPRAEDQLQKISFALLAREYMNFSLCLGYHASTIEAYVSPQPPCNYLRFHYLRAPGSFHQADGYGPIR